MRPVKQFRLPAPLLWPGSVALVARGALALVLRCPAAFPPLALVAPLVRLASHCGGLCWRLLYDAPGGESLCLSFAKVARA